MHDSNYLNNHMKFGNKLMLPKIRNKRS